MRTRLVLLLAVGVLSLMANSCTNAHAQGYPNFATAGGNGRPGGCVQDSNGNTVCNGVVMDAGALLIGGGSSIGPGGSGHRILALSQEPDSASAIVAGVDTANGIGTVGSSLFSLFNHGTPQMHFDAHGRLIFDSATGINGKGFGAMQLAGGSIFGEGAEGDNILTFSNAAASSGKIGIVSDTLNSLPSTAFLQEWFNNGVFAASLTPDGHFTTGHINATSAYDFNGTSFLTNTAITLTRKTLDTCASGIEGTIEMDLASGAATGNITRPCICASNGSSVYAWYNLRTGTVGTSTTCAN